MTSRLLVDKIEGKSTSSHVIMPPGHMIQQVRYVNTASSHIVMSGTSYVATGIELTITPKASGNKIIVECTIGMGAKRTNSEGMTALYIDGSNVSSSDGGSGYYWCGYWDTSNNFHGGTGYYEYTTVDTNAHTFALYCKIASGSGNFDLHSGASHSLVCTEIAT